jgi:hypothetical protein
MTPYSIQNTQTQGSVSNAIGCAMFFAPPATPAIPGGDKIGIQYRFPTTGSFQFYGQTFGTGNTAILYNSSGTNLLNLSTTQSNVTIPETSTNGNIYYLYVTLTTGVTGPALFNYFRFGLNILNSLATFVLGGTPTNTLTLGSGESYTVTSSGVVYVLNRTFSVGTVLPLIQFTAASAGSYITTSSNTFVIPNDVSSTFFISGQNMADTVTAVQNTTTLTPVTITVTFSNIGTESGADVYGYII